MRVLGDLYVKANDLCLSVLQKIASIFTNGPLNVQNNLLTWTITKKPVTISYQFTVFTKTVTSLRLDVLVKAICNVSRDQAQKYVEQNNVAVNFWW